MANEFKVKKGLIVDGSGTVLDVQGTQGQLFSVTDSLTGDLFSVSDISGIPILNVNSSGVVDIDGTLDVGGVITATSGSSTNWNTAYTHSQAAHAPSNANNYVHPATAGNKHVPTGGSSGQFLKYSSSGTAVWAADNNTTYSVGAGGLTQQNFTTTLKNKLDNIAASANNYSLPFTNNSTNWNTAYGWGDHELSAQDKTNIGNLSNTNTGDQTTVSGNAGTATTLQTARTINGVSFNGSANITVADSTKLPLAGGTLTGDLTVSGNQVITANTSADVKFSVWSGTTYGIGMTSGVTYGGLNDYAMTFCMNNVASRGWWWGYAGQSKSSGAMSLTMAGHLTLAGNATISGTVSATGGNSTEWNTAYDKTLQWDGSSTALTASTGRTSLGLGSLATLNSVAAGQIDANAVNASELNVSGNGTTSQYLRSDGDGTMSWVTPPDNNTTYTAGSGLSLTGTVFANTSPNIVQTTVSGNAGTVTNGAYTNVANNFTTTQKVTAGDPRLNLVSSTSPSLTAGIGTQVGGRLLSFGTNYSQTGTSTTAYAGGFFRIDTRVGYEAEFFTVQKAAVTTGTQSVIFRVKQDGDVGITGDLGIGTTSPLAALDVRGTLRSDQEQDTAPGGTTGVGEIGTLIGDAGPDDTALGTPNKWLKITLSGNDYLIPAYAE